MGFRGGPFRWTHLRNVAFGQRERLTTRLPSDRRTYGPTSATPYVCSICLKLGRRFTGITRVKRIFTDVISGYLEDIGVQHVQQHDVKTSAGRSSH